MTLEEKLSIPIVFFLAVLLGGALGGKIAGGSAWKSALAVFVGVPMSVVVFFFLHGTGSVASLLAGQFLCGLAITGLLGLIFNLRPYAIVGMLAGASVFGIAATKASFMVIAARHTSPL